jgi:hypothetical protein
MSMTEFTDLKFTLETCLDNKLFAHLDTGQIQILLGGIARLEKREKALVEVLKQVGGTRCANQHKFESLEYSDCIGEMEYFKTNEPVYNRETMQRILAGNDLCSYCRAKRAIGGESK